MSTRYEASLSAWERGRKTLVPGSATISKHPKLATLGAYPIYAREARGARLVDLDGNEFIDLGSALGAVALGYSHPAVTRAVSEQLGKSVLTTLSSPLGVELAERLRELVPSAERVRLLKNGSDAASAAARIARAYTGRSKIAVAHFHGWHDWYYVSTSLGRGIPQSFRSEVVPFEYGKPEEIERVISGCGPELAAFMMEPAHLDAPPPGYLEAVRRAAHRNGSLLIFDEVVTGFRFGRGGAQSYFGVTPDLSCFAKAMGNGFPISAVGGAAPTMDATADVITSMTYGEEALSTAAAIATLDVMREEPVHERLWTLGERLKAGFNAASTRLGVPIACAGYGVRMDLRYDVTDREDRKLLKTFFIQETANRGILLGSHLFVNYAHTDADIRTVLAVCDEVLELIARRGRITPSDLNGALVEELW